MDWITEKIAIGNSVEAKDPEFLREGGFRSVLGLITTLKGRDPVELGLDRLEIVPLDVIGLLVGGIGKDFKLFERAVETLEELVRDAPPVLVHCRAGRSRSPVVVAGYLMKSLGIKSEKALLMVAAKRELELVPALSGLLDRLA